MSAQLDDFWLPDSRTPRTPVASQRPEKGVAIGRRGNNPSKVLKAIQEKKMAAESWRTAERDAVNSRRKLEKSLAEQRATQEKVMADKQAKLDQQLEKQRQAAVEQKAQADKIANAEKRAQAQKDLADQHAKQEKAHAADRDRLEASLLRYLWAVNTVPYTLYGFNILTWYPL